MPKFDTVEIELERMAVGGAAIGKMPDGRVAFIQGGAPRERVVAEIRDIKDRFALGEVREVLRASSHRVKPPCPVFGRCGGCQWQHLDYTEQLAQKMQIVESTIRKIGGVENVKIKEIIGSPNPYNYRNRIQIQRNGNEFGFFARDSHSLVPIQSCPISDEDLNRQIAGLYQKAAGGETLPERIELSSQGEADASFSQVNSSVNLLLQDLIYRYATGMFSAKVIWDLYAGDGNLTLPLLERIPTLEKVYAVELNAEAVVRGREKAKSFSKRIEFFQSKVERTVQDLPPADLVILDPPRAGADPKLISQLVHKHEGGLIYVSCDPATLARDLKLLSKAFDMILVQPLDMFPQTSHVETVVAMVRRQALLRSKNRSASV